MLQRDRHAGCWERLSCHLHHLQQERLSLGPSRTCYWLFALRLPPPRRVPPPGLMRSPGLPHTTSQPQSRTALFPQGKSPKSSVWPMEPRSYAVTSLLSLFSRAWSMAFCCRARPAGPASSHPSQSLLHCPDRRGLARILGGFFFSLNQDVRMYLKGRVKERGEET